MFGKQRAKRVIFWKDPKSPMLRRISPKSVMFSMWFAVGGCCQRMAFKQCSLMFKPWTVCQEEWDSICCRQSKSNYSPRSVMNLQHGLATLPLTIVYFLFSTAEMIISNAVTEGKTYGHFDALLISAEYVFCFLWFVQWICPNLGGAHCSLDSIVNDNGSAAGFQLFCFYVVKRLRRHVIKGNRLHKSQGNVRRQWLVMSNVVCCCYIKLRSAGNLTLSVWN